MQSDRPGLSTATHAALLNPSLSLASCVRAYLTRSTLGAELRPDQRHNHYAASLYPTILWRIDGDTDWVRMGGVQVMGPEADKITFCGPKTVPSETRNPGPVRIFSVALLPDALQAITRLDLSAHVNRVSPLDEVLGQDWQAMAQAVLCAPDDSARIAAFEAFLLPRWQQVRGRTETPAAQVRHWMQALLVRAATSGLGQSVRQIERRVKTWAGLSKRELRGLAHAETAFLQGQAERARVSEMTFADLAALTGYADQAHLSRMTRKVTGLSPTELLRAVNEDESYWPYRLF